MTIVTYVSREGATAATRAARAFLRFETASHIQSCDEGRMVLALGMSVWHR